MKNRILYFLLTAYTSFVFGGCDIAYKYDIESGTDDYTSDKADANIDTDSSIDVSMYAQARIFPGLVDTTREEHVDATITLDLTKRYVDASTLGMQWVPAAVYSTGLYAGAGELITIQLDEDVMGLSVQIGSHTDDLTTVNSFLREPVVYTTKALFPGINTVRNPLGGTIWILKNGKAEGSKDFTLKISGAYSSPDYVLGETNRDISSWMEKVKTTTVPWMEIRGERVIFTLPTARVADEIRSNEQFASNLEEVLQTWDVAIAEYFYKFNGFEFGTEDLKYRAPDYSERVVFDVQLEDNLYMRNGKQTIMAVNSDRIMQELTDLETLKTANSISIFTMLQERYSTYSFRNPWSWSQHLSTAAAHLPLYRVGEKTMITEGTPMGTIFSDEDVKEQFPLALSYATADSSKWFGYDGDKYKSFALLSIVQLGYYDKENPWQILSKLNAYGRTNGVTNNENGEFVFKYLCDYYRKDFTPFFEHWGFSVSDSYRVYAAQYDKLDKKIWEYDPFQPNKELPDYEADGYRYRTDRRNWEAQAYDKSYRQNIYPGNTDGELTYGPARMFDGKKNTVWQSDYSDEGNIPELPYYIVIDMKEKSSIDGFYIANGHGGFRIQHLIVQTTDHSDINISDFNVEWKDLVDLKEGTDDFKAAWRNERFFEFPDGTQSVRYLRLVIPDVSYVNEQEKNQALGRRQALSEFGTFYYK